MTNDNDDDWTEPYPDDIDGGWPDEDIEVPFNDNAATERWKEPYPE
ncbi:hypothetical protein SAMN05444422_11123 [Halobiforma haloterrestris]|uniref:Uncharacterized protein n=1 Tax=Natronobacterium haloterrestre TaxID=148448 RepID=A0A1I1KBB9_NATHA|nr:hypothetical protein [Halobiforma haloterrestris]SFC58234.1 hypothetical protein SAMN05444422_11123 [Halobiforma haloterrestris]